MTGSCDNGQTGSCLCGAVRFRLTGPVTDVTLCFCADCRKASGSAFMIGVGTTADGVAFEDPDGQMARFRTGRFSDRSFCGRCGSPIGFHYDPGTRDRTSIMQSLFDDPAALPPSGQTHTVGRPDWICRIADLPDDPSF